MSHQARQVHSNKHILKEIAILQKGQHGLLLSDTMKGWRMFNYPLGSSILWFLKYFTHSQEDTTWVVVERHNKMATNDLLAVGSAIYIFFAFLPSFHRRYLENISCILTIHLMLTCCRWTCAIGRCKGFWHRQCSGPSRAFPCGSKQQTGCRWAASLEVNNETRLLISKLFHSWNNDYYWRVTWSVTGWWLMVADWVEFHYYYYYY